MPSNIAEGMTRDSTKEKVRFLNIAYGSAAELKTQIWIGMKIKYIDSVLGTKWVAVIDRIAGMLTNLAKRFKEG